ncbi:hypothetical protein D9M70_645580 [compost metagenome]
MHAHHRAFRMTFHGVFHDLLRRHACKIKYQSGIVRFDRCKEFLLGCRHSHQFEAFAAITPEMGFPSASSGTMRSRVRRFFSFFNTEKRFPWKVKAGFTSGIVWVS